MELWQRYPDQITWAVVLAYLGFIVVKGLAKATRVDGSDAFLLAGRNVSWLPLMCTMGATIVGGGASIGAVSKTYEQGLFMLLVSSGWYLHLIFAGLFVAPRFRREKLYTVAGYFGHRFGEGPRRLALLLSLFFSVFIVAAQMAAFGWVLSSLLPSVSLLLKTQSPWLEGPQLAILLGGLLVVAYSTAGGLLAVIATDIYQFAVLMLGFMVTLALVAPELWAHWSELPARVPDGFFSPTNNRGWLTLMTTFLAFFLGETFAPGYATRFCSGRDESHTRRGVVGAGVLLALTFPLILFFIAAYAHFRFDALDPGTALPRVIRAINNPLVAGLMVGALLSAVMSSADSALNSATAIFTKDLFEQQLRRAPRSDRETLRRARICTAVLGVLAIGVALLRPDVIDLLLFTYHAWAPAIVVPVIYGIFWQTRGPDVERDVTLTMVWASILTFGYRLSPLSSLLDPAVFGVTTALLTLTTLRWLRRARSRLGRAA